MSDSTKTLIIHPNLRTIEYSEPTNLLDLLNSRDVFIEQSCGGSGTCTTCRFFVLKGDDALESRSEIENERALERGFDPNERLACQTEVFGSCEIRIASSPDNIES